MNTALYFVVPETIPAVSKRTDEVIRQIGAPLRTDSGHYITGVVPAYAQNVELRVSWLEVTGGTQVTVTASHEELDEEMLLHVAERFQNTYRHPPKPGRSFQMGSAQVNTIAILVSAFAVVIVFLFILLRHH